MLFGVIEHIKSLEFDHKKASSRLVYSLDFLKKINH